VRRCSFCCSARSWTHPLRRLRQLVRECSWHASSPSSIARRSARIWGLDEPASDVPR
jgi:hypothetical protein